MILVINEVIVLKLFVNLVIAAIGQVTKDEAEEDGHIRMIV